MVRTQIQLTEEQAARVKAIARRRGVSMATVIREAVDRVDDDRARSERDGWDRFADGVGAFRGGPANVSEHHDEELVRAYEDSP
jgi:hypothetical protein